MLLYRYILCNKSKRQAKRRMWRFISWWYLW